MAIRLYYVATLEQTCILMLRCSIIVSFSLFFPLMTIKVDFDMINVQNSMISFFLLKAKIMCVYAVSSFE